MLIAVVIALVLVSAAPQPGTWRTFRRLVGRNPSRAQPSDEVALLNGLAAELRAGASLRMALVAAADRAPRLDLRRAVRFAAAGLPTATLADELARVMPVNGRFVAAAFRLAATSGARAASMFDLLALQAAEVAELSRERGSLTAQARLSAFVVGGAPAALIVVLLVTGRAQALLGAGPIGHLVAGLGIGLEVAGLAVVVMILRRAERAA